jgi:hypothetical protein
MTSYKSCPKCHQFEFKISDKHHGNRYEEHVKKCTGRDNERKISLNSSIPIVPHIQKNKTYQYLMTNRLQHLFEPTEYFMCFDLETTERRVYTAEKLKGTTIIADIIPITIAVGYCSKNFLLTSYSDIRCGNNFLHDIIIEMFENAKIIAENNKYSNPDIPYNHNEVPVLGFNSAKFDLNLMINELSNDDWAIQPDSLMMGGVSSFRKIKVKHSKSDIVLVFLDAKNFVEGGSLADFVRTFGKGESKGMFPYEAFDYDNYNEYLINTHPSSIKDFKSFLRKTDAT